MSNIFRRIFRRSEPRLVSDVAGMAPVFRGGEPIKVGSASSALTISTVYRCVKLVSESVASLPLRHETLRGGVYSKTESPLSRLLSVEPNEWQTGFDMIKQAVQQVLLQGEAYIVPQRYSIDHTIKRLVLAAPGTAGPSTGIGRYMINDPEQGLEGEYNEDEVIRLKGMSLDGRNCLSVLGFAAKAASIAATADQNTLTTFANGGAPLGILTNDSSVVGFGEIQQQALQAAANRVSDSLKEGSRLAALGGTWKLIQYGMSAADMQFLESRKFSVREICRFFGVHPSFVFDDTSNNYKSAEMANVAFLSNTLNPLLCQIESEFDRKLLHGNYRERLRFDRKELYATDLEGRMAYIEKRIQTGTLTPNEARAELGLASIDGGDSILVSANLKTINEITNQNE